MVLVPHMQEYYPKEIFEDFYYRYLYFNLAVSIDPTARIKMH